MTLRSPGQTPPGLQKEQSESETVKSFTGRYGLTASERRIPDAGHNNCNLAFEAAPVA